jgi:hypothetical protein
MSVERAAPRAVAPRLQGRRRDPDEGEHRHADHDERRQQAHDPAQ